MSDIITAVSAVGFPIVACLLMMWAYYNTLTQMQLIIENLKGTIDRNTDALNDIQTMLLKNNNGGIENGNQDGSLGQVPKGQGCS